MFEVLSILYCCYDAIILLCFILSLISRSSYEVKTSSNSVNYVEFTRSSDVVRYHHGAREEKVLVLTHGFGLGLGFFFGKMDGLNVMHPFSAT